MSRVLIIDDAQEVCDIIVDAAHRIGYEACCAHSFQEGLSLSQIEDFAVVLVDVQLPDGSGLDLLPYLRQRVSCPEVIIMTGHGDADGAELAIRNGAWDYIQKPSSLKNIELPLTRALQYQAEKNKRSMYAPVIRGEIIGDSPTVLECLELVSQAAAGNANTLICGESGTGKELFAAAIHQNSPRAQRNFVVVDCSALPGTIVESVLFGHEKGAYTGADRTHSGLIAQADMGTLFLDEIGELPMSIQKSFLRVIQERRYRPVGSSKEIDSDFKLISATNRDLEAMVHAGDFRADLLHRLTTIQIDLPPLRNHKEDITALVQQRVYQLSNQYKTPMKGFTPEFFSVLEAYDWPGNVRELNQAIERAVASAGSSPILFPKDLPLKIRAQMARDAVHSLIGVDDPARDSTEGTSSAFPSLETVRAQAVADVEHTYLSDVMEFSGGDIATAIHLSGLSRARFYALLKKHGIAPPSRSKSR